MKKLNLIINIFIILFFSRAYAGEIHQAVNDNNLLMVKSLIYGDQRLTTEKDEYGNTPLYYAVRYRKSEIARFLVENGANVHEQFRGFSLLHHIIMKVDSFNEEREQVEIAKLLISKGVSVNISGGPFGCVPLHTAIAYRDYKFCEFFITNGARINIKDKRGWTPLRLACYMEEKLPSLTTKKIVQLLRKHGAII